MYLISQIVFLASALASPLQPQVWAPFSPKEGNFSVLLPGVPVEEVTANGRTFAVVAPPWFVRVGYGDFTSSGLPPEEYAKTLDSVMGKSFIAGGRKVPVGGRSRVGEYTAHDTMMQVDGFLCRRQLICIARTRLYTLSLEGPRELLTSADANRIIASFEVTAMPPAPPPSPPIAFRAFTSAEGRFSLQMPSIPKMTRTGMTSEGAIEMVHFNAAAGGLGWSVTFYDLPAADANLKELLVMIAKGLGDDGAGSRDKILAGKYPGREFVVEQADFGARQRVSIYLVGRRLFVLAVLGPSPQLSGDKVDRFFSSFCPLD